MKATLTTLTPVHIGSGVTYNRNIDFIQSGNQIGIIDDEKILDLIGQDNIHQWTNAIDSGGNALMQLLRQRGFKEENVADYSKRVCKLVDTDTKSQQLKEQFRTSLKGPCIPGSSIKGALKTTIWNNLVENKLDSISPSQLKNNFGKWNDKSIDNVLFGKDATEKSTRFLKVGDVNFEDTETSIYEMSVLNIRGNQWEPKDGSLLFEVIPTGSEARFEMSLNKDYLKLNHATNKTIWDKVDTRIFEDIQRLTATVNQQTKSILKWEYDDLKDENLNTGKKMLLIYDAVYSKIKTAKPNEMFLRIGANSGWKFTTGGWITKLGEQVSDYEIADMRKTIQKNKVYPSNMLWPKTRKITAGGNIFGFVKVTLSD